MSEFTVKKPLSEINVNEPKYPMKAPDTASKIPLPRKPLSPPKRGMPAPVFQVPNGKKPRMDSKSKPYGHMRRSVSMVSIDKLHITGSKKIQGRAAPAGRSRQPSGSTLHSATSMLSVFKDTSTSNTSLKQPAKAVSASSKCVTAVTKSGKIPAWDLKRRVEANENTIRFMENENSELKQQQQLYNDRLLALEAEATQRQELVHSKDVDLQKNTQELERLKSSLRQSEEKNDDFERKIKFLKSEKETLEHTLQCALERCRSYETTISRLTASQAGISAELQAVKRENENKLGIINELRETLIAREEVIVSLKQNNEQCEAKLRDAEMQRRMLHNTIQELKGNIRVFCRVRPLLKSEFAKPDYLCFPDADGRKLEINSVDLAKNRGNTKYEFTFDRVFGPRITQQEVFEEISQLVQSALDGYNVCVFAYGQTGSGKTYTMEGPEDALNDVSQTGIIARTAAKIFQTIKDLRSQSWNYTIESTFLEVYNEVIRDLLGPCSGSIGTSHSKVDEKLEIKRTAKNNDIFVSNATHVLIESEEQIFQLLVEAQRNRAVAATNCNDRSSRSHSVFQLTLKGSNEITGQTCVGNLSLVDLAGSERLKESLSEGDRLREAKNINKSLSALGIVIMALAQKSEHVPYRSSKLTHLLMNSLGGNSKTLMFVNISPKEEHINETLNSLRFATQVNQCQIGTATKRVK